MQEKLQNFARLPAHRLTDSCIVALLSHGVEGGVYGVDGKLLQVCVALDSGPPSLQLAAALVRDSCPQLTNLLPSSWQLHEVFRLFDNANCPSLQNKPKMFFIQACRGGEWLAPQLLGGGFWAASHQLSLCCLLLSGAIGPLLFTAATASLAL